MDLLQNSHHALSKALIDCVKTSFNITQSYFSSSITCSTHKERLKHNGHKGDPRVTPGYCGAIGERAPALKTPLTYKN